MSDEFDICMDGSLWLSEGITQDSLIVESPWLVMDLEDLAEPGIMSDFDGVTLSSQTYAESTSISTPDLSPICVSPSLLHYPSQEQPQSIHSPVSGVPPDPPYPKHENLHELHYAQNSQSMFDEQECAVTPSMMKQETLKLNKRPKKVRPCDIKRETRKKTRPEKCRTCGKGFAWLRDLKRHVEAHERFEAEKLNLDFEKVRCEVRSCVKTYARHDHMKRHMRNKHGL